MSQWGKYHQLVGEKPNSLVVSVLEKYVSARNAALDLGAGNLRDSKFLKSSGFARVIAVDHSEESRAFSVEGVELCIQPIQSYEPELNVFDFVISCNTFFFLSEVLVEKVFRSVLAGLCSGGIFTCNVLGPEDDWVIAGLEVSSFEEGSIIELCKGFEVIDANPFYFTQPSSVLGRPSKQWHQWCLVLRKP